MKGCCAVYKASDGIHYLDHDGMTFSGSKLDSNNCLDVVFLNGKLIKETSLEDIRRNLYGDKF